MLPRERTPTHKTPTYIDTWPQFHRTHSYRTQLVPPGSHRPTATAPQTNTAPPSGGSRRTPGCYIQRPLTPPGEGLERQGSEQVLGFLKKMKGNVWRGRRSRRAAKVDPPGGFWQHSALSWHDGKQKRSKLLLGVLSTTVSFSLPTKWQFFISLINSSNIILTFFGARRPPLAAACLVCFFLTFIYIYVFWFGENRVPHSVTRFSNSFGLIFVCHRVVAARNSKHRSCGKCVTEKRKKVAPLLPVVKSRRRLLSSSLFFFYLICVFAQLGHAI